MSVDTIMNQYGNTTLPVPVPDFNLHTLADAQGSFVQWPAVLVKFVGEVTSSKASKGKKKLDIRKNPVMQQPSLVSDEVMQSLTKDCKWLHSMIISRSSNDPIALTLDARLFHYESDDCSALLTNEDIAQFLSGAMLNISIIQVFVKAMQDYIEDLDTNSRHQPGWMCPDAISATSCEYNLEGVRSYLERAMTESLHDGKKFILAPYYENYHWVLLVIWVPRGTIFMFDSLRSTPMRRLLITSLFSSVFRNMPNDGESKKKVIWKQMKCAKQTGGLECGFYVMKFIFDVVKYITSGQDMEQVYESIKVDGPLSSDDITEVRDAVAIYICDNLL